MAQEIRNGNNKETLKSGSILFLQGQDPRYMYYLHSGALEILSAPAEFEDLDSDLLLSKSKRVGIIKGQNLISGMSILFTEKYSKSLRAIEDCTVTKYPIQEGGFNQIVSDNPTLAVTILSHLFKRLEVSIPNAGKYTKLYQNISRINDNMALVFKDIGHGKTPEKLQERIDSLYETYNSNGGEFPTHIDAKFLIEDNSNILKKKYAFPGLPMETVVDIKQCNFINKFLKLPAEHLALTIQKDPSIATYMFETISENLMKVLDRIEAIHNEIDEELLILFGGEDSWSKFLAVEDGLKGWESKGRIAPDFLKNFLSLAVKIHSYFEEISGKKLSDIYPGFKQIHEYYKADTKAPSAEKPAAAQQASSAGREYANSLQQIFEFSLVDKDFQQNLLKVLNDFKKMQNPFNTEPEGRKIRRFITRLYMDLYKQVFIRSQKETTYPSPVKLMLNFGFLDETMLDDSQLNELHAISQRAAEETGIPIHCEAEFLANIYNEQENPSITEMGLSYEANLREEAKHKRAGKSTDNAGIEENIKKVMYEIDHRLLNTISVCSGSTATAFPILTSMVTKGNLANFYYSKKKVESIIKGLRDIDYSVFYRETVEKVGEAREIIQEEILPNFILLPSFGTKTMLWQELDGTNRRTRGRIVVPILFMGDLQKSLAHTLACFRWELNRTLKGAMWADPVEGGLTGSYFDYINFYKKNPKLSQEAKEKITERFKSIRTNRDRFAEDYTMWLLFEKDGIMKLNSVVREIFYRHVPFPQEIRDKLENMPAFSEIANKFKNIRTRDIQGFQRRYKKYMADDGSLPESLQKFMDFLDR